jgi:LysR family transcriptional regulator, low CO2-responsive transcriptional regulator
MDFDHLATFLEVVKHSSFSRAAEKRFRTQPAISAQIRALEEEVGAKLLDRSGGKVSLTQEGKIFQVFADEVLQKRKLIVEQIADAGKTPGGEIVIAANEATFMHVLPKVLSVFKQRHPKVGVGIRRAERTRIVDMLMDNAADFGVVSMPVRDPRLSVHKIHEDELTVLLPPRHPLAEYKSLTATQLAQYPLLLPKSGNTREAIDAMFAAKQLRPEISMELDSSELLKHFVAAGLGVSFIARSNAIEEEKAGTLRVVRLAEDEIRRDLALVYRKDKQLSRAAEAFIEIAVGEEKRKGTA